MQRSYFEPVHAISARCTQGTRRLTASHRTQTFSARSKRERETPGKASGKHRVLLLLGLRFLSLLSPRASGPPSRLRAGFTCSATVDTAQQRRVRQTSTLKRWADSLVSRARGTWLLCTFGAKQGRRFSSRPRAHPPVRPDVIHS